MTSQESTQATGPTPHFLIIGAQKAGTSGLYKYLCQHPMVVKALRKELHYFDLGYQQPWSEYIAQFPLLTQDPSIAPHHITGEASPYYLVHPQCPQRVARHMPQVKIIILLRNPIDRAFSQYHFHRKASETDTAAQVLYPKSFESALQVEKEYWEIVNQKLKEHPKESSYIHRNLSFISRGIYLPQIQAWQAYFPEDQIKIIQSEIYFKTPEPVYQELLDFLNLPPWSPPLGFEPVLQTP